jgi:hypothetical protein
MVNPILIVPIDDGSRPLNFDRFKAKPTDYKIPDPDNPAKFNIDYEIFSYEDSTLHLYNHIGEYTISCSTYDPNYKPENAFNKSNRGWRSNNNLTGNSNIITTVTKNSANNTYSSPNPVVNSTNYFNPHFGPSYFNATSASTNVTNTNIIGNISNNTITGEWLQIQLPAAVIMTSYNLTCPNNSAGLGPGSWVMLGSVDGVTWFLLDTQTGITWASANLQKTFTPATITSSYNYYRISVQNSSTNVQNIGLTLWQIYAKW